LNPPADDAIAESAKEPRPPIQPTPVRRASLRWLLWFAVWLPGALVALLLAGGLALGWWASSEGSLAHALGWAQDYTQTRSASTGTLTTENVQGSLLGGGEIAQLSWSRDGLRVQASGVALSLDSGTVWNALLGRGLHLDSLQLQRLVITDQRPPPATPKEPLQAVTLPLALSLPFDVQEIVIDGPQPLVLNDLKGLYQYGPNDNPEIAGVADAHRLRIDSLQVASGRYQAQLALGAQAPMPLSLRAEGTVQARVPEGETITLQANAQASGTLSGANAALDVQARVAPSGDPATATPTLAATARVMPWADQPVQSANATAHQLNLASLWPQAPITALSGTLKAAPDGDAWRAQVDLRNSASGPADQQRLPLQRLQATVTQTAERWRVDALQAELGGGSVQAEGEIGRLLGGGPSFGAWQGSAQARSINPAALWSALAPAALDGTLSARTASTSANSPRAGQANADSVRNRLAETETARTGQADAVAVEVNIQPTGRQPAGALAGLRLRELRAQGRWLPNSGDATQGVLDLTSARLAVADAELQLRGRFDTQSRVGDGSGEISLPGAKAELTTLLAHDRGQGKLALQVDDAARSLAWLRSLQSLPLIGPALSEALAPQANAALQGNAQLNLQWTGGLGALGYPAGVGQTAANTVPKVQVALTVPRLLWQPAGSAAETDAQNIALTDTQLSATGPLNDLQIELSGSVTQKPYRGQIDTAAHLQLGAPKAPLTTAWRDGTLDLQRLQLQASDSSRSDRITDWALQSPQPIALRWSLGPAGGATALKLDAGTGRFNLLPSVRALAKPNTSGKPTKTALPEFGQKPLSVAWDSLVWQANTLQTRGQLKGLPLAWIDALATTEGASAGPIADVSISGDLMFDGQWDVLLPTDAATPLRLSVELQRSSGDLTLAADRSALSVPGAAEGPRVAAGIQEARLGLTAQGNAVQAQLRWRSAQLGDASADLTTELRPRGAATPEGTSALNTWWPADTPVRGTVHASLPQVGVWSALAPPGWRMRGTLATEVALSGTRGSPQYSGTLNADQLALRSVVDGIAFTNGVLRARFTGERLTIDRFTLEGARGAAEGGTLEATGSAEWRPLTGSTTRQPLIELQATADRLRVSSRVDRRLTLSGKLNLQLDGPALQVRGQLKADSAQITLPDDLAPSLSSDVVVRGSGKPIEDPSAQRVQPDVQVEFDLGPAFEVSGRGLQTRLAGQLSVRATPAQPTPRLLGEVRTVSGTYRAYGQRLAIESGVLRFTGPFDDPTLDIVAVRPQAGVQGFGGNEGQRVGVQISGSAQAPRVRLFAEPDMPDSEKLAWLLLGRPATGAGAEAAILQQAAMALLASNGNSLDEGLARAFGLDELSLRGEATNADGSTSAAALTLGKRLSSDFYIAYERSLAGTLGTVSIFYDLSRRLTLRARAGEENAIDLIFTLKYD
jgi:translocation and assembly module TamB